MFDQIYLFYTFTNGATLKNVDLVEMCLVNFAVVPCGTVGSLHATAYNSGHWAEASSVCTIAEAILKVCHTHYVFTYTRPNFTLEISNTRST